MAAKKAIKVTGIRRAVEGGRVEVQTVGGWLGWAMCSNDVQAAVRAKPEVQDVIRGGSFTPQAFNVQWGVHAAPQAEPQQFKPPTQGGGSMEQAWAEALAEAEQQSEPAHSDDEPVQAEADPEGEPANGGGDPSGSQSTQGGGGGGEPPMFYISEVQNEFVGIDGAEVIGPMISQAVDAANNKLIQEVAASVSTLITTGVEQGIATIVPPMIANGVIAGVQDMKLYTDDQITLVRNDMEDIAAKVVANQTSSPVYAIQVNTVLRPSAVGVPQVGLYHHQFKKLLKFVSLGKNVYLPGPPGGGKSHSAEQVADLLGWEFGALSLGPTTPESRLWGGKDANGNFHEPNFVKCARHAMENPDSGAVFCLDEMDNGHAGIIATLNSALANGWFFAPNGDKIKWAKNFVVVGSANTYGTGPTAAFSGRNRLDAATLDRFLYLPWDTDLGMERILVTAEFDGVPNGERIAKDWLTIWNTTRQNVANAGLQIFITMRGAINGASLLAADVPAQDAFAAVLGDKIPADQLAKINPL